MFLARELLAAVFFALPAKSRKTCTGGNALYPIPETLPSVLKNDVIYNR